MPTTDKINDYEARASRWLADGNEKEERGDKAGAEKCFERAQYWLDRANKARGWD